MFLNYSPLFRLHHLRRLTDPRGPAERLTPSAGPAQSWAPSNSPDLHWETAGAGAGGGQVERRTEHGYDLIHLK